MRRQLAEITDTRPGDWFFFSRARDAMAVVYQTLRDHAGPGDVVTQAFTCLTAVSPILAGGLTPVYGDIEAETYSLDPATVPLTPATRAVVAQHTFGLIGASTRALAERAHGAGAIFIEDCAHGLGEMVRTEDGAPVADVSIHSFGAEKTLPTFFGGAAWINPAMEPRPVRAALIASARALGQPGWRSRAAARTYALQAGVYSRTGSMGRSLGARAERAGLFWPPITDVELAGGHLSPTSPSPWMMREVSRELCRLPQIRRSRREVAAVYARSLGGAVDYPDLVRSACSLVRFPVSIPARCGLTGEDVLAALTAAGAPVDAWYRPLLYPGPADPARYHLDGSLAALPRTRELSERVLTLPVDVDPSEASAIAECLVEVVTA